MITFNLRKHSSNGYTKEAPLLIEDYLKKHELMDDAIKIQESKSNPIEEYFDRHDLDEDALKTVEGRKGAELKHRLTARMIMLLALVTPMIIIPFWLMWILSPINTKHYSERMQFAFLTALASDVLGLCWVVTRDLFPKGIDSSKKESNSEDSEAEEEE